MFEAFISLSHARSLQKRASEIVRSQGEQSGGNGVTMVGRHEPTRCIFGQGGTAKATIANTERNVNWKEGSKRSSGRHTSKAIAAPPITFSEFARRQTTRANTTSVNTSVARITGMCAPTAIAYAHRRLVGKRNWSSRRVVTQRTKMKVMPPMKLICN